MKFWYILQHGWILRHSVQFSRSVSCPTLCNPMNRSTPGLPVHHQLLKSTQTHVHLVNDAIQPSYHLSSPSPPALNLSQHQGLFQWVSSASGGKSIGASASASVLPMTIWGWFPWIDWFDLLWYLKDKEKLVRNMEYHLLIRIYVSRR